MKTHRVRAALIMLIVAVLTTSAYSQWVQTNWSAGTSFFDLYAGREMIFARTWDSLNGGRLFVTADNGANWDQVASADGGVDVLSVAAWDDAILAGTWNGFYLPTLDGSDWSWHAGTPDGIPADTAILSTALIEGSLYAGAIGAIYESSGDDPNTWVEAGTALPEEARMTSIATNGRAVVAGSSSSGVYIAIDGGTSWGPINSGLADTHISQLTAVGTTLFAVTSKGVFVCDVNEAQWIPDVGGGIWASDVDGAMWLIDTDGSTWVSDANGTNWRTDPNCTIWTACDCGPSNVNCLLVVDDMILAGTDDNGVFVSADSGLTWEPFSSGMPEETRVWSLVASNDDLSVFAGTDSGVWRVPLSSIAVGAPTVATEEPSASPDPTTDATTTPTPTEAGS